MESAGPISYRSGYKYQLDRDWWVMTPLRGVGAAVVDPNGGPPWTELRDDGKLLVRAGYAWDGPSGPTWDTANFMRGSLAHDALYQLMREGGLSRRFRRDADVLLRQLCRVDGMGFFRAWYVFNAVRKFASHAAQRRIAEILVAPQTDAQRSMRLG